MDETNPIQQIDFMQAHIEALKRELSEKDAMIDWLAAVIYALDKRPGKPTPKENWIKAAQEAVKKND